jgi:hypothetical protein
VQPVKQQLHRISIDAGIQIDGSDEQREKAHMLISLSLDRDSNVKTGSMIGAITRAIV